jgi:hypothetical protein
MKYTIGLSDAGKLVLVKVWGAVTPHAAVTGEGLSVLDGQMVFDSKAEALARLDALEAMRAREAELGHPPSLPPPRSVLEDALIEVVDQIEIAPNRLLRVAIKDLGAGPTIVVRAVNDHKLTPSLALWCSLNVEQAGKLRAALENAEKRIRVLHRQSRPEG